MQVVETAVADVKILVPRKFGDDRGFFSESYNKKRLTDVGINVDFVQDNHSYSATRGTVRGLHYQLPPFGQHKLVRVVRGAILDVAVDIRRSSPTYGRHVSAIISAAEWNQISVPEGFAHGFCTLEPDTEVIYKVTAYWSQDHEHGIRWDDPALGIDWPVRPGDAVLSAKDREWPVLAEQPNLFP